MLPHNRGSNPIDFTCLYKFNVTPGWSPSATPSPSSCRPRCRRHPYAHGRSLRRPCRPLRAGPRILSPQFVSSSRFLPGVLPCSSGKTTGGVSPFSDWRPSMQAPEHQSCARACLVDSPHDADHFVRCSSTIASASERLTAR